MKRRDITQTMEFRALTVLCPRCGSEDVIYSCDPECCFNHVCSVCLESFELFTKDLGEGVAPVDIQAQERDSCAPTVACARCKSLQVYQAGEGEGFGTRLACMSCHALLELGFSFERP